MLTALYNVLIADSTLTGHLTGGLYMAQTVDSISRQNTPNAFDANGEILPCALLKSESATPWGPHYDSAREYVLIYFYQRFGYASIRPARQRVYELTHRTQITPVGTDKLWRIDWANDILDSGDQALGAAMIMSRYVATIERNR